MAVTHVPDAREGWVELLVSGLTFDLVGLNPAAVKPLAEPQFRFGLARDFDPQGTEPITLVPGPHLRSSVPVLPVVRSMAGLAANIALPLGAKAICWNPVCAWSEPGYFARVALDWIAGGPFPALGMTGIFHASDGTVTTRGLSYFAGHDLVVEARENETPAQTAKLAVRLIDYVVRYGAIRENRMIAGVADEVMKAQPAADGSFVRVVRDMKA